MKARLVAFGELEIEGERFAHDIVIEAGRVRRRHKGPSKALRDEYGHTPLSADEAIPWGGRRLIVGTGADGGLPIAPEVYTEAERRRIRIDAVPTRDRGHPRAHRPRAAAARRLRDPPAGPRVAGLAAAVPGDPRERVERGDPDPSSAASRRRAGDGGGGLNLAQVAADQLRLLQPEPATLGYTVLELAVAALALVLLGCGWTVWRATQADAHS